MTVDKIPLPRAQPCQGTIAIVDLARDDKKKPDEYRLMYDKREGIYRPVKIQQYERD
jgi:hypothetical protein